MNLPSGSRHQRDPFSQQIFRSVLGLICFAAFFSAIGSTAQARVFSNAYVSFELPDKWSCNLEQTEYVCRTGAAGVDSREAIIILTAKEVGPSDQLELYVQHLKLARTITSRIGQPIQSTVYKVDHSTINSQPWIDGMHISSEVPNYYTRYLATTKGKIAILVTFSAHKLYYTKYNSDFFRAIQSLRVVANASLMSSGSAGGGGGGGGMFGSSNGMGGDPLDDGTLPNEDGSGGRGGKGTAEAMMGFAFILLAVGAYIYLKKDKKKKPKKRRPPAP